MDVVTCHAGSIPALSPLCGVFVKVI
jgi:hypothetical protein